MRRPLMLVCMAFVAAIYIYISVAGMPSENILGFEDGSTVTFVGKVCQKEYKNNNLLIYVETLQNNSEANTDADFSVKSSEQIVQKFQNNYKESKKIKILCKLDKTDEPRIGSFVYLSGKVKDFDEASNPGEFDQKAYYRILGVSKQAINVQILKQSVEYSRYREGLYSIKMSMEKLLDSIMPQKDASTVKAMILGNKAELDTDRKELFQKSGIAHILAISGLHISLLGMGLYNVLRRIKIPSVVAAVVSVLMMIVYGDMVGMSSSAYRAIFMFGMKMGALLCHRTYDMLTALALSAVFIIMEQPLYLQHTGFLLSFGAILGIGCMSEVVDDTIDISLPYKMTKFKWVKKLKKSLSASMGIFTIQFPIMLSSYYEFPVYSFMLNLFIIPAMEVLMIIGLCCMFLSGISLILQQSLKFHLLAEVIFTAAKAGGFLCHVMLNMFDTLCNIFNSFPGADWIVGKPDSWRIVIFYIIMICLFAIHRYSRVYKLRFPPFMKRLWLIIAVVLITQKSYGKLQITFLNVGQGDGIWIETPQGMHYLIDGGSTSERKLGKYTLIPFLKYTGTAKLDAIFLTHLDQDHISGVEELLMSESAIKISRIILAKSVPNDEAHEKLVQLCSEQDIDIIYAAAGDRISTASIDIEVLHPASDYYSDDRNACSLVLKLEYEGFHALFTGDIEAEGEKLTGEILADNWKCHLYKAPHHGSQTSNSQYLIEQIQPQIAVISCGKNNSYGHPHEETLKRLEDVGSKVLRTDESGAISIEIYKGKLWIK